MTRRASVVAFKQTDLDTLCGPICLVNAVRECAGRRVSRSDAEALFKAIGGFLWRERLLRFVFLNGMRDEHLWRTLQFVQRYVRRRGLKLEVTRPFRSYRPDIAALQGCYLYSSRFRVERR